MSTRGTLSEADAEQGRDPVTRAARHEVGSIDEDCHMAEQSAAIHFTVANSATTNPSGTPEIRRHDQTAE